MGMPSWGRPGRSSLAPSAPSEAGSGRAAAAGAVLGTLFGAVTTTQFRFTVESGEVMATTYCSIEHEGLPYLAQVLRVEREGSGGNAGRLVAHAHIIGRRNPQGRLEVPTRPPRPGSSVYRAPIELTRSALNLGETGAYMGLLRGLDLPVALDINNLVQKHCSVLAKTGAGKSYAVGVLMEELLRERVPIVVVDPHGEHASLSAPNSSERDLPLMKRFKVKPRSFASSVVEYVLDTDALPDGVPLKLDARNLSARDLSELLGGSLTGAQVGILHQAVRQLREKGEYTLDELIAAVEGQSGSAKWPVLHALEDLRDLDILSDEPTDASELVAEGRASILNLKGAPPHVQEMVVARIAADLFNARKLSLVPPHLFVLEEAHNFCPERNLSKAASGDIVRTIASEGRKFGMGLCVVTQRPAKVDKNVLSQCNTQVILKLTNPNDLRAVASSVEGLPDGIEEEIQALPVGVALISDPSIAVPLFTEVRPRATRHGGSGLEILKRREADAAEPPAIVQPRERRARPARPTNATDDAAVDAPESTHVVDELEAAETLLGRARLEKLRPGELEALLNEIDSLTEITARLGSTGTADQGRLSGLRGRLEAHRERIRQLLR